MGWFRLTLLQHLEAVIYIEDWLCSAQCINIVADSPCPDKIAISIVEQVGKQIFHFAAISDILCQIRADELKSQCFPE